MQPSLREIDAASFEMSVRLHHARDALRRFFATQESEFRRVGHRTMAAFASEMSRGCVSSAPTPDDPELDRVGGWFSRLAPANQFVLTCQFSRLDADSPARRAKKYLGWSRDKLFQRVEALLRELSGALG